MNYETADAIMDKISKNVVVSMGQIGLLPQPDNEHDVMVFKLWLETVTRNIFTDVCEVLEIEEIADN